MNTKVFAKNEVVFREGELGKTFYEITEGTAGVYLHYGKADQQKLADMKPGQYFGEMAIIEVWPRSATVVAEEELRAIELTSEDLNFFFNEQPDRIKALMNQLGDRLRQLTKDYDDVNAFIREKQEAGAQQKEGFLSRLKKYKEVRDYAAKLGAVTVEDKARDDFGEDAAKAVLPVKYYNAGEIIFREGDESVFMYQIHGGSVSIFVNYGTSEETKLTTLYTNAFFGEMGIVSNDKRSATAVVAENETVLEAIRAEDLETLFKANPMKVEMILGHLANRLRRLTADYLGLCWTAAK
ncbi:MAG: cyclic nucleotide-binding domain-containing protein [Clostridia bacterium]|nr:cyclic nucleotide-binding domain-containing protein [Clostridia bacterium]